MTQRKSTNQNWVAKHAHKSNKAQTFVDRKKAHKAGYRKHRGHPQQAHAA